MVFFFCLFFCINQFYFQLYSWGGGACLGCGSPEAVSFKPRIVEDLQSTHIVDIACGDSHCLALTHGNCDLLIRTVVNTNGYTFKGNKICFPSQ